MRSSLKREEFQIILGSRNLASKVLLFVMFSDAGNIDNLVWVFLSTYDYHLFFLLHTLVLWAIIQLYSYVVSL